MTIEMSRDTRQQAVASIERWFLEERGEKVGNIAAGALLGFFMEEIAPCIYNQAVADVQERLRLRVDEVDVELHEDAFQYWRRRETPVRKR